jgi:hypothetical protein
MLLATSTYSMLIRVCQRIPKGGPGAPRLSHSRRGTFPPRWPPGEKQSGIASSSKSSTASARCSGSTRNKAEGAAPRSRFARVRWSRRSPGTRPRRSRRPGPLSRPSWTTFSTRGDPISFSERWAPIPRVSRPGPEPFRQRRERFGVFPGDAHAGVTVDVVIRGRDVRVEAESINLASRNAQVRLDAEGNVSVRGRDLTSHARRVNRIKGGAIRLN